MTNFSANQEKIKLTYVSVGDELSGIKAGDGGFNITVGGQTTLVGGVIASSQAAVERNLNYFSTNGLYIADLLNLSHYDASSTSFSASLGYDPNGGGMWKGFTPGGAPLALGASEKESGMSYSGISAGTIINNGQSTFVDSLGKPINTMVRTGDPSGKIENVFDLKKIQSELAIGAALSQEAGLFLSNVAKDYPETWGDGKPARLLFTALVGGLTGNLSGSGMDVLQSTAGSVIQGLGAKEIKELLSALPEGDPKTEALRAGLQALAGCAGGAATGNCASRALGAASSVVLTNLFLLVTDQKASDLTQAQKDQLTSLVTSIIAGTATALGGNAGAASLAARIEAENNQLTTTPLYYVGPDGQIHWLASKVAVITPSGKLVWVRPDEIPSDLNPSDLIAIGMDFLGFSSNEEVARAGAAGGLLNNPSDTNIVLTAAPIFVKKLAKPINIGTTAFDIGKLGVQALDNGWLQIQFDATFYKPIFDQYGNQLTLPNVPSVDYWDENPCLYTVCH